MKNSIESLREMTHHLRISQSHNGTEGQKVMDITADKLAKITDEIEMIWTNSSILENDMGDCVLYPSHKQTEFPLDDRLRYIGNTIEKLQTMAAIMKSELEEIDKSIDKMKGTDE